mmetsp:Transcript_28274/g.41825  ORF Transcript_28274/g.41825 Transcript_28274/m.41825 type:complete len:395 (-) Transcript_28274:337-1521(-)
MNGQVKNFGCDAILCPSGTYHANGKQGDKSSPCKECPDSEFLGSTQCLVSSTIRDREILELFYKTCGGDNWWNRANWTDPNVHICNWHGISCKGGTHSVLLGSNNIVGTPPEDLFELSQLEKLWLYSNPIKFKFDGIEKATELTELLLDSTGLTTVKGIGKVPSLIDLDLRFNSIGGEFPYDEIKNLVHLKTLSISDNALTGHLSSSLIEDLASLTTLRLGANMLSGPLPDFTGFHNLHTLDLSDNQFSGEISTRLLFDVDDVSLRTEIDLSSNNLEGTVPWKAFRDFSNLELYLRDNNFVGIDEEMCRETDWNGGEVGKYSCDALLCPPGTYSNIGRQSDGSNCEECASAQYYGSVHCSGGKTTFSSAAYEGRGIIGLSFVGLITLLFSLCFS